MGIVYIIQGMNKTSDLSIMIPSAGRLDKMLVLGLAEQPDEGHGLSRARLQQLIKQGHVSCEGKVVLDPNHMVVPEQVFQIQVPPAIPAEPEAQDIPLDIIFEDKDLLVINKPVGLVVHPAAGNWDQKLVNALLSHCGDTLSGIGGVARPGIVHRLDKDTSGLMVVAKHDAAHHALTEQFADRSLSRVYQAIIWGLPNPLAGEIETLIGRHPRSRQKMGVVDFGGKEALTYYKTLEAFGTIASLVECTLATGRTHQIRVHMAHKGHPLVGDALYGSRKKTAQAGKAGGGIVALLSDFPRQALHAGAIKFIHPTTKKSMNFKSPLPPDLAELLKKMRKKNVV